MKKQLIISGQTTSFSALLAEIQNYREIIIRIDPDAIQMFRSTLDYIFCNCDIAVIMQQKTKIEAMRTKIAIFDTITYLTKKTMQFVLKKPKTTTIKLPLSNAIEILELLLLIKFDADPYQKHVINKIIYEIDAFTKI